MGADDGDEQAKADLLALALALLRRFAELYKALDGFVELYGPALELLEHVESKHLPAAHKANAQWYLVSSHADPVFLDVQAQLATLTDALQRLLKFARQARTPLRLQAHKPIPIPTYIPKFESTSSNYLRRQDPDHEKNQASKLRSQYKQERKGAIRELRKDARFLAGVEQKK